MRYKKILPKGETKQCPGGYTPYWTAIWQQLDHGVFESSMKPNSDYLIDEYPIKNAAELPLILKSLRHQKGWSQQQIADLLDISQKTMSSLERNSMNANFSRIAKLVELLGAEIVIRPKA